MKKIYILLVVMNVTCTWCFGQGFFTGFKMRQSFQTADAQQNPAALQLTIPDAGKSNWLVDAGLAVTLGKLSQGSFTSKLVGEFHRNTLTDSLQYNYQLGYNFSILKSKGDNVLMPYWTGNIKYVRDIVDSAHSVAGSVNLLLYRTGRETLNLGRPGFLSNGKYTYQLCPSFEAQYQQVLASDKKHTGAILRPLASISTSIAINKAPAPGSVLFPQKSFELALSYVNRYAIINSTNNAEKYTKQFKGGINYYFFNNSTSSAAFGGSYNLGSDPLNGLKDQRYWQFALLVQL